VHDEELVEIRRVADVMGTVVSIAVWHRDGEGEATRLGAAVLRALAWLREVDDRFTTWRPGSEWLAYAEGRVDLADTHPDIRAVVAECDRLRVETAGAFALDADPNRPPDPAAYVKGWGTQRAADLLVDAGAAKVCVSCGGDVVVWGGERAWRVGIQSPFVPDEVHGIVELREGAVATSGRYERGDHLYDPRTGQPATAWASVTVVGPDLGRADAYSTAAFAAGEDALGWLSRLPGYSSYLIAPDRSTTSLGLDLATD
jgi:thiamine biosynthesis lipoprotein